MAEFNPDDVNLCKRDVVVLQTVKPYHALVKTNRILLALVFVLMALILILGFVFMPRQNILEELGRSHELATVRNNPVLSAEIDELKGQMFGLISGSIEGKLRSLEDNIRKGSVTDSLDTLQELKNEVKILSKYSLQPAAKAEQVAVEQKVIKELSELKGLIYLTIVSCGLMIAALGGVWLRHRYRLLHPQTKGYLTHGK